MFLLKASRGDNHDGLQGAPGDLVPVLMENGEGLVLTVTWLVLRRSGGGSCDQVDRPGAQDWILALAVTPSCDLVHFGSGEALLGAPAVVCVGVRDEANMWLEVADESQTRVFLSETQSQRRWTSEKRLKPVVFPRLTWFWDFFP